MKTPASRQDFGWHFTLWLLRAALCAAPSFFWAYLRGYRQEVEIAGMVAAIATAALAFGWATARPFFVNVVRPTSLGHALALAVNLRTAIAAIGALHAGCFLPFWADGMPRWVQVLSAKVAMVDAACGDRVMRVVAAVGQAMHAETGPDADSFFWTYVTTLLQGGAISLTMLGLALIAWPFFAVRRRR
ncbi:MAG: hypothetical protein NTV51_21085 [Verrucomicrobia bacterium]|nr:hypothetical protein [Verrucomicrobiota bacterium]